MSSAAKRTFSLPAEPANVIGGLVASGKHASGSEIARAELRALQEGDDAVSRWLRDEVAHVYDATKANPTRGLLAETAFAAVRMRHTARLNDVE